MAPASCLRCCAAPSAAVKASAASPQAPCPATQFSLPSATRLPPPATSTAGAQGPHEAGGARAARRHPRGAGRRRQRRTAGPPFAACNLCCPARSPHAAAALPCFPPTAPRQDPSGRSKGSGTCEFERPEDALHAISTLSNTMLGGRQIHVRAAGWSAARRREAGGCSCRNLQARLSAGCPTNATCLGTGSPGNRSSCQPANDPLCPQVREDREDPSVSAPPPARYGGGGGGGGAAAVSCLCWAGSVSLLAACHLLAMNWVWGSKESASLGVCLGERNAALG